MSNEQHKADPELWLGEHRGIHIPQDFASSFRDRAHTVTGVSNEDWTILGEGPENPLYWEAWTNVQDNAVVTMDGIDYFVHQDSDCWLVPLGMEWSEDEDRFVWPRAAEPDEDEDSEDERTE